MYSLENEHESFKVDTRRRLIVLGGLFAGGAMLIGGQLFHLQVMNGGEYRNLAEDNRISLQPIPALRGRILDRHGRILVENSPDFQLAVIPELTGDIKALLKRMQPYLALPPDKIEKVLRQVQRQRGFLPLMVQSRLTWAQVNQIESRIHTFPGASIQVQTTRSYPNGDTAAHLLGYLGEVNEKDILQFPSINFRSGDIVGKTGMERMFELELRGKEGFREMEVNAVGRHIRELKRQPARPGPDLRLTIDVELQAEAERALMGLSGSTVCLDPNNGEVLAMVSQPSYDPNQFIRGFSSDEWKLLVTDPKRPLINKAIQGQYPPGSTFKMTVALAALREGKISPYTRHYCSGSVTRDNHTFYCWKNGGHGQLDLVAALEQSCDVFFYKVSEALGIDALARQAKNLGFGETTGIGLEGERPGLMPSRAWKKATYGHSWYPGETLITAIGQGAVLATPLQLASMIAAIANGGRIYRPTFVPTPKDQSPTPIHTTSIQASHLDLVRKGLIAVLHGKMGTARQYKPEKVMAAGKTGTSQVVKHKREKSGKLIKEENSRFKDHALFVAYAPVENPRLALSVVVEHGGHGASAAAPVAKRIFDFYFDKYGIPES
ncbi:MAG: penicillin-binding protein 2 [Magnetococcales bacterium]|nr:penicillin-binding protein 2 [Magnetococcales bacterium]MBF0149683.1 penicillin-binding protein 2 [Magnetococcales bacterium]MBF0173977.1 penicillin-binding protein 2 [Magnetococcales bacterium]MBF0346649.1 penicillin-binding protein 2 [Magnetococcales bacterium]MBF0630733.1 penicillin-binding protein 2 [Magnetococcales bacterium]